MRPETNGFKVVKFTPSKVTLLLGGEALSLLDLKVDGNSYEVHQTTTLTSIEISLPHFVKDGRAHNVLVTVECGGDIGDVEETILSEYISSLERSDEAIAGWIYDKSEPGNPVVLDIFIDGNFVRTIECSENRGDVRDAGHPSEYSGFSCLLPPAQNLLKARKIEFFVHGTAYNPFGLYVTGLGTPVNVAAIQQSSNEVRDFAADGIIRPQLIDLARSQEARREHLFGNEKSRRIRGAYRLKTSAPVIDVIIPVYRGKDETLGCINSVIQAKGNIAQRIIVIDDCGPEPELSAALSDLQERGEIVLLKNERNLGFVQSVNKGMLLSDENDVILLNSDTLVPERWADRLYSAAQKEETTGTVTALSNNATICSLPKIGGITHLPYHSDLATIDNVCQRTNWGRTIELPSAHGFCMYVKRELISEIGVFDAETFGKGYGEENDFSIRAATRGWRNVAACDVFVQHLGSVSFGPESLGLTERNLRVISDRYPDYHHQVMDFINRDPLSESRNDIQKQFWKDKDIVIVASLSIGGGVAKNVADEVKGLLDAGYLPLILSRARDDDAYAYKIASAFNADECLLYPKHDFTFSKVIADILNLNPVWIQVHHILDMDMSAAEMLENCGIPYQVALHDYFYVCPRVTMLDEAATFCGLPEASACNICIARASKHSAIDDSFDPIVYNIERWRRRWSQFLDRAERVYAPSEAAASYYRKTFPLINIDALPHEVARETLCDDAEVVSRDKLRVAIIGAIGPHKGLDKILELMRHAERWARDIEFALVGHSAEDDKLSRFSNISFHGAYDPPEAISTIQGANCQVAIFLSPWPETYSYTLSEALSAGLNPVVLDIGACSERLLALEHGVTVSTDAGPKEILSAIRAAADATRRQFEFFPRRPSEMLAAPKRSSEPIVSLAAPEGVWSDSWLKRQSKFVLFVGSPVLRVLISLFVPVHMSGQFVTVYNGESRVVRKEIVGGEVTDIILEGLGNRQVIDLRLYFDYDEILGAGDIRSGAAKLASLCVDLGNSSYSSDGISDWVESSRDR